MKTNRIMLDRLCHKAAPNEDWIHFANSYEPLIYRYVREKGINHHDAEEVVQEIFLFLHRQFADFEHNGRTGAFRMWLRNVTHYRCLQYLEKKNRGRISQSNTAIAAFENAEDTGAQLTRFLNKQHDRVLLNELLEEVSQQVSEMKWKIFQAVKLRGISASECAQEFGVSTSAVYKAKFTVQRRLKELARRHQTH